MSAARRVKSRLAGWALRAFGVLALMQSCWVQASAGDAVELDNGFYRVSVEPTDLSVRTLDGRELYLGDAIRPDILRAGMRASDTSNAVFDAVVRFGADENVQEAVDSLILREHPHWALVVDGTVVTHRPISTIQKVHMVPERRPSDLEARLGSRANMLVYSSLPESDRQAFLEEHAVPNDEMIPPEETSMRFVYWERMGPREEVSLRFKDADLEYVSVRFYIHGEEAARKFGEYLGIRHPGHRIRTTYTLDKPAYEIGEDVFVTVRIENVGDETLSFVHGGRYRSGRNNQFRFTATHEGGPVEDIFVGTGVEGGLSSGGGIVQPGEVYEARTNIRNLWFAFDKPGDYEIEAGYLLRRTGWTDYAGGRFTVTIMAPDEPETPE